MGDLLGPYWTALIINPITHGIEWTAQLLWGNYGLAIIAFTIFVKLCLLPLTLKQLKSAKAMQALTPKIAELKKTHGDNRAAITQGTMDLYKEHRVNPAAGCLPLLIQFPILIGLYQALYGIAKSGQLSAGFLWVGNLGLPDAFWVQNPVTHSPNGWFIFPILAGLGQFVQQRMMMQPSQDPQQKMMNQVMQFMPLMIIYFGATFPAGLGVYWVTSTLFAIVQQYFITGWGQLLPGTRFSTPPKPPIPLARTLASGNGSGSSRNGRTGASTKTDAAPASPLDVVDDKTDANGKQGNGARPPSQGRKAPIQNPAAKHGSATRRPKVITSTTTNQRRTGGKR
jgi:YidC/Oxa1 family membrane protein insertase